MAKFSCLDLNTYLAQNGTRNRQTYENIHGSVVSLKCLLFVWFGLVPT